MQEVGSDVSIPDFQTLMLPALRRVAERRWRAAELIGALADEYQLTPEERAEMLPSGRQTRMANRCHWAIAYLAKSGLLTRVGRGEYEASAEGRELLRSPPERITLPFLMARYPALRAFREAGATEAGGADCAPAPIMPAPTATPDDVIDKAVAEIEIKVRDELLERLLDVTPERFERVVIDVLIAMGYGNSVEDAGQRVGRSGDGGIDGVISEDPLGLDLIYVQAKRYRDTAVTSEQLRGFAGALDDKGARKGVFITTSRFTPDAKSFAERQQLKRIVLIDGERLTSLMVRHDVGVRAQRVITLKRIDLDYFEPEEVA
jgi:restriction system protein